MLRVWSDPNQILHSDKVKLPSKDRLRHAQQAHSKLIPLLEGNKEVPVTGYGTRNLLPKSATTCLHRDLASHNPIEYTWIIFNVS